MEKFTKKLSDGRNILPKGSVDDIHRLENGRAMLFLAGEAIDKFANYEDEEEKGRLIHLPLAIGDKVYAVHENGDLLEYKVISIEVKNHSYPMKPMNFSFNSMMFHCATYDNYLESFQS